jgi:hypothetical protein
LFASVHIGCARYDGADLFNLSTDISFPNYERSVDKHRHLHTQTRHLPSLHKPNHSNNTPIKHHGRHRQEVQPQGYQGYNPNPRGLLSPFQGRQGQVIILKDVDIKATRRFSKAAKEVLPKENTTADVKAAKCKFILKHTGSKAPLDRDIQSLLYWVEDNRLEDQAEALNYDTITYPVGSDKWPAGATKLSVCTNILAAIDAFKVPISTNLLFQQMEADILSRPINKTELASLFELLPRGHKLVTAAIQSLTFYFWGNKIPAKQNEEIDGYMNEQPELLGMFNQEFARFGDMRRERRAMQKAAAEKNKAKSEGSVASQSPKSDEKVGSVASQSPKSDEKASPQSVKSYREVVSNNPNSDEKRGSVNPGSDGKVFSRAPSRRRVLRGRTPASLRRRRVRRRRRRARFPKTTTTGLPCLLSKSEMRLVC